VGPRVVLGAARRRCADRFGCLPDGAQARADQFREIPWRHASTQAEDPSREFGVWHIQSKAVDLEKGEHCDERESLIAIDERLAFGDAMRERGGLESEIRLLVEQVVARAFERALEPGAVAELIAGLLGGAAADRCVQFQRVGELEPDRLVLGDLRTSRSATA
jgi:hypothetical protein